MKNLLLIVFVGVVAVVAVGCGTKNKTKIKAVVDSSEWYTNSIGFSSKGGKGYYKQKVDYSFNFNGIHYQNSFNNGPEIGTLSAGDSILVEVEIASPTKAKVLSRVQTERKKLKMAKGTAK